MRIAILGAGAMGSVIEGHLAAAGNDVDLIDINEGYVTAVNSNGRDLPPEAQRWS